MGKIYRFPLPKYLSKIDPSDRSGTYILGIGMLAGSALLSTYGLDLALGIVWAIGILFVVGLFWEYFPKPVRLLTLTVGWLGVCCTILTVGYALFLVLSGEPPSEGNKYVVALMTFGSSIFGLLFFADVIRGARASAHYEKLH